MYYCSMYHYYICSSEIATAHAPETSTRVYLIILQKNVTKKLLLYIRQKKACVFLRYTYTHVLRNSVCVFNCNNFQEREKKSLIHCEAALYNHFLYLGFAVYDDGLCKK